MDNDGCSTPKPVLPDFSGDKAWDHFGLANNLLFESSIGQKLKEVFVDVFAEVFASVILWVKHDRAVACIDTGR